MARANDNATTMLVLAGGFGTRLQSVVSQVPKALAPVGDVPFLSLQIKHWISQGVSSFVFLLHHQASQIISFLQAEQTAWLKNYDVQWLIEPIPMDTGGAVAYAVKQLGLSGDFLVANADTWLSTGIEKIARTPAPAIAVVELSNASRYGRVVLDATNHVIAFHEKSGGNGRGIINAGLSHLNADTFNAWSQQPFSLERITFPDMAKRGELMAVVLQTDFIDIGIPDDYSRFCRWIAADRKSSLCG